MSVYAGENSPEAFLSTSEIFPRDERQLLDKLNVVYTDISKQVNCREIARYENTEMLTGQQFYDPNNAQLRKYTYRKVFFFDSIVSGATLNIAHGITGQTLFTYIGGGTYDVDGFWKPLPYSVFGAAFIGYQLDVTVGPVNIRIVNGTAGTAPDIVRGVVILEYLKN